MVEMTVPEFCRWYSRQLRTEPATYRLTMATFPNVIELIGHNAEHEQKELRNTINRVRALLTAEAEFHFIAPETLREALDGPERDAELVRQMIASTPMTPLTLPLDEDTRT